jgi:hypothetical protein
MRRLSKPLPTLTLFMLLLLPEQSGCETMEGLVRDAWAPGETSE